MNYRIKLNPEGTPPTVDILSEGGKVLQSYPMLLHDGKTWVPAEVLLIIETLKEEGMKLDCIEYPFQGGA